MGVSRGPRGRLAGARTLGCPKRRAIQGSSRRPQAPLERFPAGSTPLPTPAAGAPPAHLQGHGGATPGRCATPGAGFPDAAPRRSLKGSAPPPAGSHWPCSRARPSPIGRCPWRAGLGGERHPPCPRRLKAKGQEFKRVLLRLWLAALFFLNRLFAGNPERSVSPGHGPHLGFLLICISVLCMIPKNLEGRQVFLQTSLVSPPVSTHSPSGMEKAGSLSLFSSLGHLDSEHALQPP